MLDNIRLFALAVESGSISQAANKAKLTLTTASRKLKSLEQDVGGTLFHRSKKGLKLTPLGDAYYNECAALVHALDERLVYLDQDMSRSAGPLTVLVPTNLAAGPLDLFWQQFVQRYPDIRLNVRTADPDIDMLASGADIALRSGKQDGSRLRQSIIGGIRVFLVCAADYPSPPQSIDELNTHPCIMADMFSPWQLCNGTEKVICEKSAYRSNDLSVIRNITLAGQGIALLPESLVSQDLQSGRLIQVLPQWQAPVREISMVWPYQHTLSARASLFKLALTGYLAAQPWFKTSKSVQVSG